MAVEVLVRNLPPGEPTALASELQDVFCAKSARAEGVRSTLQYTDSGALRNFVYVLSVRVFLTNPGDDIIGAIGVFENTIGKRKCTQRH